jgi:hypothetical protein
MIALFLRSTLMSNEVQAEDRLSLSTPRSAVKATLAWMPCHVYWTQWKPNSKIVATGTKAQAN